MGRLTAFDDHDANVFQLIYPCSIILRMTVTDAERELHILGRQAPLSHSPFGVPAVGDRSV